MSLNKKIQDAIDNRPQYNIQDEAYQNQDLAKNMAFGRDRASQQAEQNIMTQGADTMGAAQQVSGSTNALLDTLAGVTGSQNQNLRDLGVNEANVQSQRMRDLYGANSAMIDEQDKAWNFNVNEPYQNQVQALRDRKKFRQELLMKGIDSVTAVSAAAAGGASQAAAGAAGAMMSDERVKRNVTLSNHGIDEIMKLNPVEFNYNWDEENHIGFIAQEVKEILPECVINSAESAVGVSDLLAIKMHEIIPVLVKSLQQQQEQIKFLKEELESIKSLA